jgi:hypothetical protein
MWLLARAVGRLLHYWWRSDRIRVSPCEGRLLRLAPPCFLRIAGESAEVVARHLIHDAGGPLLVHRCADALGSFELEVRQTAGASEVRVRRGGRERRLAAADVEVIPVQAGMACLRRSSS